MTQQQLEAIRRIAGPIVATAREVDRHARALVPRCAQGDGQLGPAAKGELGGAASVLARAPRELSNEQHLDRLALRAMLNRECEDFARGEHELAPGGLEAGQRRPRPRNVHALRVGDADRADGAGGLVHLPALGG